MSDDAETRFELAEAIKAREAAEATIQAQAQQIAGMMKDIAEQHGGHWQCRAMNDDRCCCQRVLGHCGDHRFAEARTV